MIKALIICPSLVRPTGPHDADSSDTQWHAASPDAAVSPPAWEALRVMSVGTIASNASDSARCDWHSRD
jgi:hypothetical protein